MRFADTVEHFTTRCLWGNSSEEKIDLYHNLIKTNIENTLIKGYPLTLALLSKEEWNELVTQFLIQGESHSPFLWKMPQAFFAFVKKQRYASRWNLPYLNDLLHMEWIEIDLFMRKDAPKKKRSPGVMYLNAESKLLHFQYPVFRKIDRDLPPQKGNYPVLAYRHPMTSEVHFISLSPFFASVLKKIKKNPQPTRDLLLESSKEFNLSDTKKVLEAGERFFSDLLSQQACFLEP